MDARNERTEGVGESNSFVEVALPYNYREDLKDRSRELRKNMTKEERKLWYRLLRDLPIRFHRQKMIGAYIVDFYCATCKLVIEIDGSQHYTDEEMAYDNERSKYLEKFGIDVVRYSNRDINENFNGVCNDIMHRIGLL